MMNTKSVFLSIHQNLIIDLAFTYNQGAANNIWYGEIV